MDFYGQDTLRSKWFVLCKRFHQPRSFRVLFSLGQNHMLLPSIVEHIVFVMFCQMAYLQACHLEDKTHQETTCAWQNFLAWKHLYTNIYSTNTHLALAGSFVPGRMLHHVATASPCFTQVGVRHKTEICEVSMTNCTQRIPWKVEKVETLGFDHVPLQAQWF